MTTEAEAKATEHHIVSPKLYVGIFFVLLALTATTTAASYVELYVFNVVVALAIAVAQGIAGGPVLHAREVQPKADEADGDLGAVYLFRTDDADARRLYEPGLGTLVGPFAPTSSARYAPSWPVNPVIKATVFIVC